LSRPEGTKNRLSLKNGASALASRKNLCSDTYFTSLACIPCCLAGKWEEKMS
jgi:hypothetical protein